MFMHCQLSQRLWFISPLGLHNPLRLSLSQWMQQWLTNHSPEAAQLFGITLWHIWKVKNYLMFNKKPFCPVKIAAEISGFAGEYNAACGGISI
jgi:hypothetical protein